VPAEAAYAIDSITFQEIDSIISMTPQEVLDRSQVD
jgi:hypothetical protein